MSQLGELMELESSRGENSWTVYRTCRLCWEAGVRREQVVISEPCGVMEVKGGESGLSSGLLEVLKEGRGTRCVARKSDAGTSPAGDGTMQMVPPVIITRTRDSEIGLPAEISDANGTSLGILKVGWCSGSYSLFISEFARKRIQTISMRC